MSAPRGGWEEAQTAERSDADASASPEQREEPMRAGPLVGISRVRPEAKLSEAHLTGFTAVTASRGISID